MGKRSIRAVSALLVCVILFSLAGPIPAEALQSRTENFSKDYKLTGYGAQDMVSIAMAQLGKTGKQMGYSEEWCCDFLCDCAILAGQADAIPAYAACTGLYNKIMAAGGKKTTSSPKPGDICFINWDGGSHKQHVELVYKVEDGYVYTIGGNTGSGSSLYKRSVSLHDPLAKRFIVTIVRPAYKVLDTSYATTCDTYGTSGTVTVGASTQIMSQPCESSVDPESVSVGTAEAGSKWNVSKLYSNPLGQLWYQVQNGTEKAYLSASGTFFTADDLPVTAEGIKVPSSLDKGDSFSLKGKIRSSVLPISQVRGAILQDGNVLSEAVASASGASFSLSGSKIDTGLLFGKLAAGSYELTLSASVKGYFADEDGKTLRTFEQETVIYSGTFTVVEHICQWRMQYRAAEHPHYAIYCCDGCGARKTDRNDTVPDKDCTVCYPPEPKIPKLQDGTIQRLCEECCIHPFFVTCPNCQTSEN